MDADVQQLSSGEEEEIDSTTKDKGKGKNQKTSSDKPRVILTGKKCQHQLSSDVWVHFEFLDEPDENDNMDPQMAMLCGSVMKLKVGDNDDTPQTSPELEEFDENGSSNIV
uniref:Uncharacterized protein n=1 Tax=Chenopodium quinoa TaxID=63459 RepID=A0A803LYP4_CHEQI